MSDENTQPEAEVQAAPEEVVEKPKKRKLSAVAPAKGFKVYVTTQKHSYPFDIQIAGEILSGQWSKDDGFVEFLVPDELVAGFEKHFHFVSGNVVAD